MGAKYMLHPGWIISASDRQRHWVSARNLMSLYKVAAKDCVVCRHCQRVTSRATDCEEGEYIHLKPYSGRPTYDLTKLEEPK